VFAVGCLMVNPKRFTKIAQLNVQAVFVRQQILKTGEFLLPDQFRKIGGNRLFVFRIIQLQIDDPVSQFSEAIWIWCLT
jgi:hypothetical protein